MVENNKTNLKKCGEIIVDINTKCNKDKMFIFYCTFCNIKCTQLQQFSQHINEHLEHLAKEAPKETVIKIEPEPEQEEFGTQSFSNTETSQVLCPKSEEILIREIKKENETNDCGDLYYDSDSISENAECNDNRKMLRIKASVNKKDSNDSNTYKVRSLASNFSENRQKYKENSKKTSLSRTNILTRQIRDLENCRKKCMEKISKKEQQYLFNQYWSCASYQQRQIFIANLIDEEDTQTHRSKVRLRLHTYRYHLNLPKRSVPVCKKCFIYTLSVSEKFIKTVMKKKKAGKLI